MEGRWKIFDQNTEAFLTDDFNPCWNSNSVKSKRHMFIL